MNDFYLINSEELYLIEGGCWLCTTDSVIAGSATGAGTVLALSTNPAGWVVLGGAIIGGGLGYLLAT